MLADPLNLSTTAPTAGTGSEVEFVKTAQEGKSSTRLNSATNLSTPEQLVIKHQAVGNEKAGTLTDRHLISLSRAERDAAGVSHSCVINLTISVPRNGLFDVTEVTRQLSMLENLLLTSGVVTKILQNQH